MTIRPKRAVSTRADPSTGDMEPSIIRGALNNDMEEVQAALINDPGAINVRDMINEQTALHITVGQSNLKMSEFLLKQPQLKWGIKDRLGRDIHDIAILSGHPGIIRAILHYRANRPPDEIPKSADVLPFKPS